jgi:RING finger protein 113A
MPQGQETQKASYIVVFMTVIKSDDYKDRFTVHVEKEKSKDSQNIVQQTIQKFMNITSIDQIDPKKAMPKTESKPETSRSKVQIVAPSNVRFTCRFDYNPSLCKDYHDTGYCTFGDSCIYIHDRGDYKSGWEQEKEWEESQKQKAMKLMKRMNGDESSDEEMKDALSKYEVPELCQIC